MTRKLTLAVLGLMTVASMAWASPISAPVTETVTSSVPTTRARTRPVAATVAAPTTLPPVAYRHGDCSWLPSVAAAAGWPAETHKRLATIARRESGCCPNVRGGDVVDADCSVLRVREWNHRSDSGLLQINGVHWKPDHPQYDGLVCRQMGICTQEPLLDPLTNLRAAKLLWDVAGWSPWRIPSD